MEDGVLFSTRRISAVLVSLWFIAFAGEFTAETERRLRYAVSAEKADVASQVLLQSFSEHKLHRQPHRS